MKQKAIITIEGESTSRELHISCVFDPPAKDGEANAAADLAATMLESLKGAEVVSITEAQ